MGAHINKEKPIRFVLPNQQPESEFDPDEMTRKHQGLINQLAETVMIYAAAGDRLGVIWLQACCE